AIAGIDDPQAGQREITHRTRGHADILAELRFDQNDNGTGQFVACFRLVGARTGHLTSLSDSTSQDFESSPEGVDSKSRPQAYSIACLREFLKQNNWVRRIS